MGASALQASDSGELALGQILLDVNNGRIYAIRSDGTDLDATGDRIFYWHHDGSVGLSFSISSFSDGQSSPQLIGGDATPGSGDSNSDAEQWILGTSLNFSAGYGNYPGSDASNWSTTPYIQGPAEWTSLSDRLPMSSTTNHTTAVESTAQNTNYPFVPHPNQHTAVGQSKTFTLHAQASGESAVSRGHSVQFYNQRIIGLSSTASGYDSDFLNDMTGTGVAGGKGGKIVTSGKNGTYTFTPSANDYLIVAYRKHLGTSTFNVGGFSGGMEGTGEDPLEIPHTNSAGFTEPYYLYRSDNHSLGDPTVEMTIT